MLWKLRVCEWIDSKIAGYKIAERESEYGNLKQRWLIIESEARKKSSIKQVERLVEKQKEKAEAALRQLSRQEFACQPDAEIAISKLSNSLSNQQVLEEYKDQQCDERGFRF